MTAIKICGVTHLDDARRCVDLGVEAIGLNFWPRSPRCCDLASARAIVAAVGNAAQVVAVTVDADEAELRQLRLETGIDWLQLHGDEPPELLQRLLPHACKALPVHGVQVLDEMVRYPGEHILLDAASAQRGGSGKSFDWTIAAEAARTRLVTLAGGLRPGNVAQAITIAKPFRVDTASGVEHRPGRKNPALLEAFVQAVRGAHPDRA